MKSEWHKEREIRALKGQLNMKLTLVGEFLLGVSKALTPVGTGAGSGRLKGATDYQVHNNVLRIGNDVEYAPYVEFDTKPHIIVPREKKSLFWKGAKHPVGKVNHPGTKAQPFLTPLITDFDDEIIRIMVS